MSGSSRPVTPVPGIRMTSSGLHGAYMHMRVYIRTYTYIKGLIKTF